MTEFKSEYGNLAEEEYQLTSIIAKWVMLNASRKTNQFNLIRDSCGNQTLLLFAGEKAVDKALLLQVFTNLSLQQRLWEQLCAFLDNEPNGYILKDGLSVDQAPESVEANRIMGAGSDELTEFSGESGQENREETPVDDPDTEATVTRQPIFRSVAEPVHARRSYVSTRGVVATLLLLGGFFGYIWWPKSDPTAPAPVVKTEAVKSPAAEPVAAPAPAPTPLDIRVKAEAEDEYQKSQADKAEFARIQKEIEELLNNLKVEKAEHVRLDTVRAETLTRLDAVRAELVSTLDRFKQASATKRLALDTGKNTLEAASQVLKMLQTATLALNQAPATQPQTQTVSTPAPRSKPNAPKGTKSTNDTRRASNEPVFTDAPVFTPAQRK